MKINRADLEEKARAAKAAAHRLAFVSTEVKNKALPRGSLIDLAGSRVDMCLKI